MLERIAPERIASDKVGSILRNPELSRSERVARLRDVWDDARATQRLASESRMAWDDGFNSDLRDAEIALQRLGQDPVIAGGKGAATL